ncbi:MAG: urease accessory protein UreD [Planctomycetes bacterium]|nr:urease accessory protein UreD [Planctomycetota bacterium]
MTLLESRDIELGRHTRSAGGEAEDASRSQVSAGEIAIEQVAGRSAIVRLRGTAPLKLLCPRRPGPAAWVYVSSFGGGLVAGDAIELDVTIGEGATGVLMTQASTKVYHRQGERGAKQTMHARIGDDGLLVVMPDPIVCFAQAVYEQRQRFDIEAGGSLVLLDWITSGRAARGERWAFDRYDSRNEVTLGGKRIVFDRLRLDQSASPIDAMHAAGASHCFATLMLIGEKLRDQAKAMCERNASEPLVRGASACAMASLFEWGAVMRIAGRTTEEVGHAIRAEVGFLNRLLGAGPWDRKW